MEKNSYADIQISINSWLEQIKSVPSITASNSEELKNHLLDSMDNLKDDGLDDEEAFWIASRRMGDLSILKNEFDEVNMTVIQMRKIILILSGILGFFLLYSLMQLTTRLLFIELYHINIDPVKISWSVLFYLAACHFILIFSTILVCFLGKRRVKRLEMLKIKPPHTLVLFAGVICFVVSNLWLNKLILETFNDHILYFTHYSQFFDYLGYTFPLTIIICFVVLFKIYYSAILEDLMTSDLSHENHNIKEDAKINVDSKIIERESIKNKYHDQWENLKKIGLDENEAFGIILKRNSLGFPKNFAQITVSPSGGTSLLLILLSGILVYFFVYFLLHSTIRISLTVLQHFENNAILNIKRVQTFVIAFHLIFIFFATSIYFRDMNLIQKLKQIIIKPFHTRLLLLATIFFAILDRCFFPIARNAIGSEVALKYKFESIFIISNYSLLFVIWVCFWFLYNKYYRENIKIK